MKTFFDLVAPVYDYIHGNAEKTAKKIESLAGLKPSDRVLDVGGGSGRIAKFFVGKVRSVTVVDPSQKMIEVCQRRPGLSCAHASAESIPLPDASVDAVTIVDAFHHFSDPARAVQEIRRVLAEHGRVVLEELNPRTPKGKVAAIMETLLHMGSIFYDPVSLVAIFKSSGFHVETFDMMKGAYYLVATKQS